MFTKYRNDPTAGPSDSPMPYDTSSMPSTVMALCLNVCTVRAKEAVVAKDNEIEEPIRKTKHATMYAVRSEMYFTQLKYMYNIVLSSVFKFHAHQTNTAYNHAYPNRAKKAPPKNMPPQNINLALMHFNYNTVVKLVEAI